MKTTHPKRVKAKTLQSSRDITTLLENELEAGVEITHKINRQRMALVKEIQAELMAQQELYQKIHFIKKEFSQLQKVNKENFKVLRAKQNERITLEHELAELEQMVDTRKVLKVSNYKELVSGLNNISSQEFVEKSVLLTCVKDIVETTENNEFEDAKWLAKVAKNSNELGVRLKFTNLSFMRSDLKAVYSPLIKSLGERFSNHDLRIVTRTKIEKGIVTALDMRITIPLLAKVTRTTENRV